jgi:hypothetical protein
MKGACFGWHWQASRPRQLSTWKDVPRLDSQCCLPGDSRPAGRYEL